MKKLLLLLLYLILLKVASSQNTDFITKNNFRNSISIEYKYYEPIGKYKDEMIFDISQFKKFNGCGINYTRKILKKILLGISYNIFRYDLLHFSNSDFYYKNFVTPYLDNFYIKIEGDIILSNPNSQIRTNLSSAVQNSILLNLGYNFELWKFEFQPKIFVGWNNYMKLPKFVIYLKENNNNTIYEKHYSLKNLGYPRKVGQLGYPRKVGQFVS